MLNLCMILFWAQVFGLTVYLSGRFLLPGLLGRYREITLALGLVLLAGTIPLLLPVLASTDTPASALSLSAPAQISTPVSSESWQASALQDTAGTAQSLASPQAPAPEAVFNPLASRVMAVLGLMMILASAGGFAAWVLHFNQFLTWKRRALAASIPGGTQEGIRIRRWDGPACSFGIHRPTMLLPEDDSATVPEAFKAMCAHELAHCQSRHALWNLLQELAAWTFWFNPAFRGMLHQGQLQREIEADQKASQDLGSTAYARLLLAQAEALVDVPQKAPGPQSCPSLAATWTASLSQRITALIRPARTGGKAATLVVLLLAAGIALAACVSPAPSASATDLLSSSLRGGPVLEGETLVSLSYGQNTHPLTQELFFHAGVDLCGQKHDQEGNIVLGASPVLAWADGTVIKASPGSGSDNDGQGNLIEIRHADGFVSRYAHLGLMAVEAGQEVKKGQYIGESGKSGRSTGTHLHFELVLDGITVDPLPLTDWPGLHSLFDPVQTEPDQGGQE